MKCKDFLGVLAAGMTITVALTVVTVGSIIFLTYAPPVWERFTEFYVLGPSGKAEGYPNNLTVGESGIIIIGVVNHEYKEITYSIVIRLDNQTIGLIDSLILSNDGVWEQHYVFKPEKTGEKMKLEFLLYRNEVKETYRSLHLWITARMK